MNRIKSFLIFIIATIGLWVSNPSFAATSTEDTKEILLLNSYHRGFKWSDDITEAVLKTFRDSSKYRVFVEFMDSKRFQTPEYFNHLALLYQLKYKRAKIDGIICSDNNALDFIIAHGDSIWGVTPVSFCGINNPNDYINKIDTNRFKGVEEKLNILSTLQTMTKLQPNLDEIIVIGDNSLLFPIFLKQFNDALLQLNKPIKQRLLIATTNMQLRDSLESIDSKNKAIYLLSLYINRDGIPREMILEGQEILNNCNIPIYGNWDFLMPNLVLGGTIIKGYDQGLLAAKIMKCQFWDSHNIPFHVLPPEYSAFDNEVLKKFSINSNLLPPNHILLNKAASIFERFKTEIASTIAVLIVLLSIIITLISNIIQRKRTEVHLLESEKRLELALETANQGLWDINLERKNIFINRLFANLLGYDTPKDLNLSFENWVKYIHINDIEHIAEAYTLHKQHKTESISCEIRLKGKNDQITWVAIYGKITQILNNEPVRIIGTILNINSQKEFELQLKSAKDKAEESDRLKSSFLANMSHEIRTPMNAIMGFADLISTNAIDEEERDTYLKLIKGSGETLLTLINDIIDISKIESEQLQLHRQSFDLDQLLYNIQKIGLTFIKNNNKTLKLILIKESTKPHHIIYSDPYRLQQILLNLLTNAIKFTPKGKIEFGYRQIKDNLVQFYVIDTGHGIAEEHKEIIFERFRQGDESLAKKYGGTGLGLAISQSLVTMLGGTIRVESEISKGSSFFFTIASPTISPIQ